MSSEKEISSTEKLLGVIRGKETPETADGSVKPPPQAERKPSRGPLRAVPVKGPAFIGVDCGKDTFRFVKIGQAADGGFRFAECAEFPHQAKGTEDPEFAKSLRNALKSFCGGVKNFSLWAILPSNDVEVSLLRIPKVSKKQIDQAVLFTARKAMTFDEKQSIFDYDIRGEVADSGITKLAAVAYTAPRGEVNRLRKLLDDAGFAPEGLTILPFALQNLFKSRWIPADDRNVAVLTIGDEGSRIEIFSNGEIGMTRWIRAGLESMVQELMESVNEKVEKGGPPSTGPEAEAPAPLSPQLPGNHLPPVDARALVMDLFSGTDRLTDLQARFGLEKETVYDLIKPAAERLIRQVERTFEHFTTVLGNERIRTLYISSTTRIYSPLVDYIGGQLALDCTVLDPLAPDNPFVAGATSGMEPAERTLYAAALGAALSAPMKSMNLLHTYEAKKAKQTEARASRIIFTATGAILAVCLIALAVLGYFIYQRREVLAGLEKQLLRDSRLNEETIAPLVAKVKEDRKNVRLYREKYLDMAAINELSTITPSNIKLLNVRLDMGGLETAPAKEGAPAPGFGPPQGVIIEGIVTGDPPLLESTLAGYILKLQTSPLFSKTEVTKSTPETFENQQVVRFILNAKFA